MAAVLMSLTPVFCSASCAQGPETTPEEEGAARTGTAGNSEAVKETVLDAYVVCDDVEMKDLRNIGIIWGIGCGWIAGSTIGGALAGPIGAGVGGALGAYVGAHDPWLQ